MRSREILLNEEAEEEGHVAGGSSKDELKQIEEGRVREIYLGDICSL
jgi:hypothetical protein